MYEILHYLMAKVKKFGCYQSRIIKIRLSMELLVGLATRCDSNVTDTAVLNCNKQSRFGFFSNYVLQDIKGQTVYLTGP